MIQSGTARCSRRPTRAEIDLDAVSHNVGVIRAAIPPRVRVMAVVKANAYGHGAVPVARTCLEAGATWLAVGAVDEGLELRDAGIGAPILVIGPAASAEYADALRHDLTLAAGSLDMAMDLAATARALGTVAEVHAKVDTGLCRYGLAAHDAVEAVTEMAALSGLRITGIYTHLVAAEAPDKSLAHAQLAVFSQILASLARRGVSTGLRHAANSAATLELPEAHLDMVRPGLALYGYAPDGFGATPRGLVPAMTLRTCLIRVARVPEGTGVGYNHTFYTARPTLIGTVPVGYADGLPRPLSNRGAMLVGGQRCPIVGGVCMDQTMLDVSDVPGVAEGDPVVAIGRQGDEFIGADEVGALSCSNTHESLCRIGPRVPRDYTCAG
jgi:alanine racemase